MRYWRVRDKEASERRGGRVLDLERGSYGETGYCGTVERVWLEGDCNECLEVSRKRVVKSRWDYYSVPADTSRFFPETDFEAIGPQICFCEGAFESF
jgi:hypothetical protein